MSRGYAEVGDLSKASPVAVITGASSGFGAATAVALGRLGFQIVVGARRLERLKRVAGEDGVAMALDVTDLASINAFVRQVSQKFGRLDVFINNPRRPFGLRPAQSPLDHDRIPLWKVNVLFLL